jgi:hypothetical protein
VNGALVDSLISDVKTAAEGIPDIDTVEADTTDIQSAVDQSLNDASPVKQTPPQSGTSYAQQVPTFNANNFRNQQTADIHFGGTPKKAGHGADFGATSTGDYVQKAQQFLQQAEANNSTLAVMRRLVPRLAGLP